MRRLERRLRSTVATGLAGLVGLLVVTGCEVGPGYERPGVPEVEAFRFDAGEALDTADTAWWRGFNDPVLEGLIDEALRNNLDVRVATGRVEEFAARVGVTRSSAFPQVGYDASAGRTQSSREVGIGAAGGPRVSEFFEANLNVGWELDLFGRVRHATDAAVADMLAAEEARRGVLLSLVSAVATSYVGLLSLDEQLELAQRKLATRRENVALFELQFSKGVISRLEVEQARSELERTAAIVPTIERDIAVLENAMSVLLGRPPGEVERSATMVALQTPAIPAGLPSDLLRRRPDLREAEQRLVAANERIGVAMAEFYPRFSLTAALGYASDELSNLFTGSAGTYTLAAGVTGPLFTAGLLENQLNAARAVERQAIDGYRAAVLTALRESEDALVTRAKTLEQAAAQARQVEALAKAADLAQQRYDNGFVGYLDVLDAERDLFDAELQRAQLRASALSSVIAIYKAFGGGWVSVAEQAANADATPNPVDLADEKS